MSYSRIRYPRHTENEKGETCLYNLAKKPFKWISIVLFTLQVRICLLLSILHLSISTFYNGISNNTWYLTEMTNDKMKMFVIEMWIHLFCVSLMKIRNQFMKQFNRKMSLRLLLCTIYKFPLGSLSHRNEMEYSFLNASHNYRL